MQKLSGKSAESEKPGPLDPAPLARTLIGWLWATLVADVLLGAVSLGEILLQPSDSSTPYSWLESTPGMEGVEMAGGVIGLAYLAIWLVSGFVSLKWIYRVSRNANAMAAGLTTTPRWAVGWFFVPFANLWRPFSAVREAWQVGGDPKNWRALPTPSLLRWWWGFWLADNLLSNLLFRLDRMATTVAGAMAVNWGEVAGAFVGTAAILLFIRVVREITRRQVDALTGHAFG